MKKKLLKIATRMIELEEKCQRGENLAETIEEMEKIAKSLSLDELAEVEQFVSKKIWN